MHSCRRHRPPTSRALAEEEASFRSLLPGIRLQQAGVCDDERAVCSVVTGTLREQVPVSRTARVSRVGESMNSSIRPSAVVLALSVLVASCATPGSGPAPASRLPAASGTSLTRCEALATAFAFPGTRLASAESLPAGALKHGPRALPAHCVVKGRMHERKGADGHDYAIGFEMRLPVTWNGRLYYQGNGGLDGNVVPATGVLGGGPRTGALMQGFAVISSDAGHTGRQNVFFGLEPQARLDYGYQAVAKLTPMAKALIAAAYGKGPDRSYIGGCSNGGRHAMVTAARLGGEYDGYLVGAPGYRLPLAAFAQLRGVQLWTPLATPGATVRHPMNPRALIADLGSALEPRERRTVAEAILARCDALDGARDGMVLAGQSCQRAFDLQRDVPTCVGARTGACLTPAQKQVLGEVFAGVRTASGQRIYSPFPWDPGIAGANWAQWKFVNALALDPLAAGTVFTVPPGRVDPATADIDALLARANATDAKYRESSMSLMTPPGHENPANLAGLRARGAKLVLYHGASDAIFSAEDSRRWVEAVDRAVPGGADGFVRYFPVPGMNHCSGGLATDHFDLLAPLVRWVEEGVAPQAVVASARGPGEGVTVNAELPADWSPTRTRPLCAYPSVANYQGSGSIEEATSFVCR